VQNGVGSTGTHAITEDVRNALAQIAKSTVPHVEHETADHEHSEAASEAPAGAEALSGIVRNEAPEASAPAAEAPFAETPVEILDIPVPVVKSARSSRRISTQDAEQLLGSVLGALPDPKPAGQGHGRVRASRRASSAGAVVTPSETAE
jgi:ribonuclease E